jgi:serine/threonine protein kinase
VHHCHENSIAHRDIKPENFAFGCASGEVSSLKLLDFGLSRSFAGGQYLNRRAGSPYYVAPEVLTEKTYDHNCDAWSMGVLAFFSLTGRVPFSGPDRQTVFSRIKTGCYDQASPLLDFASDSAQDFIQRLLIVDPTERMTVEDALKHEWMSASLTQENTLAQA